MAQTTEGRIERIRELLEEKERSGSPETLQLPAVVGDKPLVCPVITLRVDEVVLNPHSHRIKAQLQDDPKWTGLEEQPYSEEAQLVIARLVRAARSEKDFSDLKSSLDREGQEFPGVITHAGVLMNANTRAVALRELDNPAKRFIRVAVLPETVQDEELTLLELRLQMSKELKVDYTLTNELLFIDELFARAIPERQIAQELRIFLDNPKKGEKEVQTRLRLLDLIRQLQRVPSERPPLTFFDVLGYEQLREVLRDHDRLARDDSAAAQRLLERFLISIAVGVTQVHQLRKVDSKFMDEYMYPQLEDDQELGRFAENLTIGGADGNGGPGGDGVLDLPGDEDEEVGEVNLARLIDAVTGSSTLMTIPGSDFSIERRALKDGIKGAILAGIKEKNRDTRDENKLDAPVASVKRATKELVNAAQAVQRLDDDPEFDERRKRTLEAAFKKMRKRQRELEAVLADREILT